MPIQGWFRIKGTRLLVPFIRQYTSHSTLESAKHEFLDFISTNNVTIEKIDRYTQGFIDNIDADYYISAPIGRWLGYNTQSSRYDKFITKSTPLIVGDDLCIGFLTKGVKKITFGTTVLDLSERPWYYGSSYTYQYSITSVNSISNGGYHRPVGNLIFVYNSSSPNAMLISVDDSSNIININDSDSMFTYPTGSHISIEDNISLITKHLKTFDELYNQIQPTNFFLSSPATTPINLNRGDSVILKFSMLYGDIVEEYDDVRYIYNFTDRQATFDGNTLTISENATASYLSITAKPNIEGTDLFALISVNINDPKGVYEDGGTSSPGGGEGSFGEGDISTPIVGDIPSGSTEGDASASGTFTRYLMNSSYLDIFGNWLWDINFGLVVAKETISLIYGEVSQSILGLMSYPFNIATLPGVQFRDQNIYWGNWNTQLNGVALTDGYATIDWGTIRLSEYWGNFLDYSPHTKIELYLPWGTGFVPIDPGECLPGTIQVITNIELDKGTCIHNVIGNGGSVIGTFGGVCGKQIPLMSTDTSGKALNIVTTAASAIVAGTSGMLAGRAGEFAEADYAGTTRHAYGTSAYDRGLERAVSRAEAPYRATQRRAANIAAVTSLAAARIPGSVQRNSSGTGSGAGLGIQYPYIILSRPTQSVPAEYGHHYGYPSNLYLNLGLLRGYTEIGEIHLTGIPATDSELAELDSILKGGVIF